MNRTEYEVGSNWHNSMLKVDFWGDSTMNPNNGVSFTPCVYGFTRNIPNTKVLEGHVVGLNTGGSLLGGTSNLQIAGGQNTDVEGDSQSPKTPATAMYTSIKGLDFIIPGERCEWKVKAAEVWSSAGRIFELIGKDLTIFTFAYGDWWTGKPVVYGIPCLMGPSDSGLMSGVLVDVLDDFDGNATYVVNTSLGNMYCNTKTLHLQYAPIEGGLASLTNDNMSLRLSGPNPFVAHSGLVLAFTQPYIRRTDLNGIFVSATGWGGASIKDLVTTYSTRTIEMWRKRNHRPQTTAVLQIGQNRASDETSDNHIIWQARVAEFAKRLSNAGYEKVVLCPPYIADNNSAAEQTKKKEMWQRMRELRDQYGWGLLDVMTPLGDMTANTVDAVHLNLTGADAWGAAVVTVLNDWATKWKAKFAP